MKPFKPGPPGIKLKGGELEKLRKGEAVKQQLSSGSGGRGLVIQVGRVVGTDRVASMEASIGDSIPNPNPNVTCNRTCTRPPRWCGAASSTSPPTRAWSRA